MNKNLLKEFIAKEFHEALAQITPQKSRGSDGFSACFYQEKWPTIGEEVCKAISCFFNWVLLMRKLIILTLHLF
jgi:hypothetical protein